MYIKKRSEIVKIKLEADTIKNVEKQVLIGGEQGWDSHVMRMFILGQEGVQVNALDKGGWAPLHHACSPRSRTHAIRRHLGAGFV